MATTHTNVFKEGPITADFVGNVIARHQSKTNMGAHTIFMGQVRADVIDDKQVCAITYSAYPEMANKKFHEIRETALKNFKLTSIHISHSLGKVKKGEICLFVLVAAAHRKDSFRALEFVVERIKADVPIFGKELFEDASYQWKVNT